MPHRIASRRRIAASALVLWAAACSPGDRGSERGPLVVYNAGSLALPIRAVLDSFSAATGIPYEQENAGSLETARKMTELGKIPDVIALADHEVFPALLVPEHTTWYVRFARNRLVIAYTDRSRFAGEITPDNWHRILLRGRIETGRADPNLDPAGYRALLAMQLAGTHYEDPDLATRLFSAAPERNVRPKEVDLVALLQAGELDYVWQYESVSRAAGLRYVRLPSAVDLGSPDDSAAYASAVVRVVGKAIGDSIEVRGSPIVYGFSIPRDAPHPKLARAFASFMLGAGQHIMRGAHLPVMERPALVGSGAPGEIVAATGAP
ncbi:MAG TPA: extracellular solute-binding protein [Gemmatimonadaceae bacterium]|nr:extracellular solute-binding protein [Gemmatimonadaceae bacterium]